MIRESNVKVKKLENENDKLQSKNDDDDIIEKLNEKNTKLEIDIKKFNKVNSNEFQKINIKNDDYKKLIDELYLKIN